MLVALWQFDTEGLLAGLLLFRLLYYLVPFAIEVAILGGRELWIRFTPVAFACVRQAQLQRWLRP